MGRRSLGVIPYQIRLVTHDYANAYWAYWSDYTLTAIEVSGYGYGVPTGVPLFLKTILFNEAR